MSAFGPGKIFKTMGVRIDLSEIYGLLFDPPLNERAPLHRTIFVSRMAGVFEYPLPVEDAHRLMKEFDEYQEQLAKLYSAELTFPPVPPGRPLRPIP